MRHVNRYRQSADTSNRSGDHLFGYFDRRVRQINLVSLGNDSHHGQHARAECRGNQVRRRERLAFAVIVDRGVGDQLVARGGVGRFATQAAEGILFDEFGSAQPQITVSGDSLRVAA